ncbi:hypothetical protein BJV78DRAFT_1155142 [Lactifluus subvellereus]|nr:hypothetical protein BJV78DRAFT_1155142 [Lactifluus subvellereus]
MKVIWLPEVLRTLARNKLSQGKEAPLRIPSFAPFRRFLRQCPFKIKPPLLDAIHVLVPAPSSAKNAREHSPVGKNGTDTSGRDRPEIFKRHWEEKHGDQGAVPARERFEIYSPDQVVGFITNSVMSVDDAAAHAHLLVVAKMWELGKQDVWGDPWGRKERRVAL